MPSAPPASLALTEDELDNLLYFARTGSKTDLADTVTALASTYSVSFSQILSNAVDPESGNTCLHYACANGHLGSVRYLVSPPQELELEDEAGLDLMLRANNAGNTALHYAAMNGQLDCVKLLLEALSPQAPTEDTKKQKSDFVSRKNNAGHDAAFEAESAGKDDVVNFLLGVMDEADADVGRTTVENETENEDTQTGEEEVDITISAGDVTEAKETNSADTNGVEQKLDGLSMSGEKG